MLASVREYRKKRIYWGIDLALLLIDGLAGLVVIVLLALALPLAVGGANDGFSLLWYMLIPIFTLVLLGMPFGVPACIGFGLGIMLLFWTPVRGVLLYSYPREYLYYYLILFL